MTLYYPNRRLVQLCGNPHTWKALNRRGISGPINFIDFEYYYYNFIDLLYIWLNNRCRWRKKLTDHLGSYECGCVIPKYIPWDIGSMVSRLIFCLLLCKFFRWYKSSCIVFSLGSVRLLTVQCGAKCVLNVLLFITMGHWWLLTCI